MCVGSCYKRKKSKYFRVTGRGVCWLTFDRTFYPFFFHDFQCRPNGLYCGLHFFLVGPCCGLHFLAALYLCLHLLLNGVHLLLASIFSRVASIFLQLPLTVAFSSSWLTATLVSQPFHDDYQMLEVHHDYQPHRFQSSPTCYMFVTRCGVKITAFIERL